MKICLVGGIYGKRNRQRSSLHITPETTLEKGLREQGHSVSTYSHYDKIDYSNFDVVHVHHLSFGALAAACSRSATPFVFTVHDVRAMNGALSPLRLNALEFVLSRADAVVALSNTEREFLQSRFQTYETPRVIPNGIDSEIYAFVPRGCRPTSARRTLLYVGQLIPLKRVDVLIDAMRQLPKDVELLLAYHNRTLEEELKLQAKRVGLMDRIRFLGPKTPKELARLYRQADLFVLPTSSEALPSVITEAMLCGTPVVATNVGGIVEQIGPFGITVPPGHVSALAHAIMEVFSKYGDFLERSRQMAEFARERSSIHNMIERHIQLYSTLTSAGKPVRHKIRFHAPINKLVGMGVSLLCKAK